MLKLFSSIFIATSILAQSYIKSDAPIVNLYEVYEIELSVSELNCNPFKDIEFTVTFIKPDGDEVSVDGFYDGDKKFKARAYCSNIGTWKYLTKSNVKELNDRKGKYDVVNSNTSKLKGKLRVSNDDPYQMVYDNGKWFLHIGDTGYRYVINSEPFWKEYIDQSVDMGATKIRVWFSRSESSVESRLSIDRERLSLETWQEFDRRIQYALNNYPDLIIQLIPYGEGSEEIKLYSQNDFMAQYIGKYSQARWSSFPNVYWCLSNDRIIVKGDSLYDRKVDYEMINNIGKDFAAREPWGTLITNHQARSTGYDFYDEDWSDIITLEELDGVDGKRILEYREKSKQPIINDEDRYGLYRNPGNRRYFFRRLMWASLLSGGAATYGGINTWAPYEENTPNGVQGYFTMNERGYLFQGGHDFKFIHKFFDDTNISLINMIPNDSIVGNKPLKWKCISDSSKYIIYLANPSGDKPQSDNPGYHKPKVEIDLPANSEYSINWYDPKTGNWEEGGNINGGINKLSPPRNSRAAWKLKNTAWGDRVILIKKIDKLYEM